MTLINIPVDRDSCSTSYNPDDTSCGTAYRLQVRGDHVEKRLFLQFDISDIPAEATIVSAHVWMRGSAGAKTDDNDGYIGRLTQEFSEDVLCWDQMPDVDTTTEAEITIPGQSTPTAWHTFDVSSFCKIAYECGDSLGVGLRYKEIGDFKLSRYLSSKYVNGPYLKVSYTVPVVLAFADVAISRRYGDKLYLSGKLEHIVDTDEICVLYSRPGDAKLLNLKGATVDYTYIKNAFGSLTFDTRGKYLEFTDSGYYILEAWDVTDDCETRSQKRASWVLNVTQPKYQYQLYFDVDAPELGGKGYLLQAEWDKYNSWKPYRFTFEEPDCFPLINGTQQTTPQQVGGGWLCQAAEPLGSGCAPLPWWMCRSWTNWDIYMRGECSCDHFQNTLKPLGIPCHHLIAMYEEYGSEPPYCGYVKCP